MVSAADLWKQMNLSPRDLGTTIVPISTATAEEETTLAVNHLNSFILPVVLGEINVALAQASQGFTLPIPTEIIWRRYPANKNDQAFADNINAQMSTLLDGAIRSLCRSELLKQVASNNPSFDVDSTQDRVVGNQQLKRLTDFVVDLIAGTVKTPDYDRVRYVYPTVSVPKRRGF